MSDWANQFRKSDGWAADRRRIEKEFTQSAGPTSGITGYDLQRPVTGTGRFISQDELRAIGAKKKRSELVFEPVAKARKTKAEQIADANETKIAASMERGLRGMASKAKQIAATGAVPAEALKDQLKPAISPLVRAARQGAQATSANDNAAGDGKPITIGVSFDDESTKVQEQIQGYALDLIQQVTDDSVAAIRRILSEGQAAGQNPIDTARDIRDVIGLTESQALAVVNYRRELEQGSPGALQRSLRDKRFDPSVRAAIAGTAPLDAEQIDAMVERYRDRFLAYRAQTIARTEAMRAVNTGSRAAMQQAIDDGTLDPGQIRRTWIATEDDRTRPDHRDLDGQTVGWDEPYRLSNGVTIRWPHDDQAPADQTINCLLPGTRILAHDVLAATSREFDGDAIIIKTASGLEISCTVNHPILTPQGWVRAQLLREGDRVVRADFGDGVVGVDYDQDRPTLVEEFVDTLGAMIGASERSKIMTSVDFHGDGADGEVRIVSSNRHLTPGGDAAILQPTSQGVLNRDRLALSDRSDGGAPIEQPVRPFSPSNGGLSGAHLLLASLLAHLAPFEPLRFVAPTRGSSVFDQNSGDGVPNSSVFGRESLDGHSGVEVAEDGLEVRGNPSTVASAAGSALDAGFLEPTQDGGASGAEAVGAGLERVSGLVELDHVVSVERRHYRGPVYNLETASGMYVANGIVNHNCRCTESYEIGPGDA